MLYRWAQAGIAYADLAIRRSDGVMLWQRHRSLALLSLSWARALNVRLADIYIRPARGYSWPLLFLDDVPLEMAQRIARKYAALLVHTSPAGGCHIWLRLTIPLHESQRRQAQKWLVPRTGADPCSVSGEHLGRLAGMKNWKRHGVWVNVVNAGNSRPSLWDPTTALQSPSSERRQPIVYTNRYSSSAIDHSESGREWGWVRGAIEAGIPPDIVYRQLLQRASQRRGRDAERYAKLTLHRAIQRLR